MGMSTNSTDACTACTVMDMYILCRDVYALHYITQPVVDTCTHQRASRWIPYACTAAVHLEDRYYPLYREYSCITSQHRVDTCTTVELVDGHSGACTSTVRDRIDAIPPYRECYACTLYSSTVMMQHVL